MAGRFAFANGATPDFKGGAGTVRSAAVRLAKAAHLIWKRTYIDWLAEKTGETRLQQPIVIADVEHGAESNDWNVRRSCFVAERARGIGAGHVRETEVEQAPQSLAHQVLVLGEHDPDRHVSRIRR